MSVPISTWDALYRQTDQPKTMTLTFSDGTVLHNSDIILEQMSLEESLCSEENLRYGCCESSCFQVRIANTEKSFEGLYLNVVQAFPPQLARLIDDQGNHIVDNQGNYINGGDMYFSQYGNFLVVSDTPTGDRQYRDLTCYDKMYEIIHANVIDWYEGLTFPMTVKDFRDGFFEYLEIEQVEVDLINDDFEVQGEFYVSEELSGRMVIESICELNGAFGHINRDGLFEYITLPTSDSLTYPHYVNNSCAYEDYETEAITGVRAINVDGDSGTIVGTEDNMYIMQSNILTFGSEGTQDLEDALDNLLDLISEFTYTPFKVTTYGNPMLPLGTNVTFETKYKTINSFVMTRFLSGIQALRDTFTALGDRKYPEDVNRIKNEIQRSAGQTHKLINDVNTLDSEIFDEQGNSRIQQTLSEVVLKVDSQGNVGTIALGVTPDPTSQDPSERVTQVDINADFLKFKANTQLDLEAAKLNITSDNFTLDEDGNLTCNNATMTNADIGGKVTASSGEIGPYIIDSTGLRATVGNFYASLTPGQIGVHNGSRGAYFTPNSIDFNQWTGALITGTHINFNNPTDSSTTLGDAFLGKKDGVYWNAANVASIDAGYLMHGKGTGHYYACNWTGSRLDFYVDVTNVGYVSDRRLKNEIQEVDANLIKAICECKTYQYKAFNRGGLISVGIIAQDFVSNCKKYGIEPMEYEVCQKTIFKADDDTEYYTIEYSQYLTLKSIHLQNQIDELKELTKK